MLKNFILPTHLPNRKILSVDIGGSLAKVAFYIPRTDPMRNNEESIRKLTALTIPCKLIIKLQ